MTPFGDLAGSGQEGLGHCGTPVCLHVHTVVRALGSRPPYSSAVSAGKTSTVLHLRGSKGSGTGAQFPCASTHSFPVAEAVLPQQNLGNAGGLGVQGFGCI